MKEIDPREALIAYVEQFPTQGKAAKALGVSGPFLSDMLRGFRKVSDRVLDKLGVRRVVVRDVQRRAS